MVHVAPFQRLVLLSPQMTTAFSKSGTTAFGWLSGERVFRLGVQRFSLFEGDTFSGDCSGESATSSLLGECDKTAW